MSTLGNRDFNIAFNDSVLETKGWYGSRYEGKQLNGSEINTFTDGDTSFGTTPVVRNVSRNIYVGNSIIDLEDTSDPTLTPFPSSSYVLIEKYFTIDEDDTITENNYDGSNPISKKGFYRSFYEDFSLGGDFQLLFLDETITNLTADNYKVIFNQGRLHQNVYWESDGSNTDVRGYGNLFDWGDASAASSDFYNGTFNIRNNQYTNFYTGSRTTQFIKFRYLGPQTFFPVLDSYLNEDVENRAFVTFENITSGSIVELPQYRNNYVGSYPYQVGPLARFTTAEIKIADPPGGVFFRMGEKNLLGPSTVGNYPYVPPGFPELFRGDEYNYYISSLNNSIPSILTNLHKSETLPDGTGVLPFIIIPSNIHPYIKDNLIYLLAKAGVSVGNRIPVSRPDSKNQTLT